MINIRKLFSSHDSAYDSRKVVNCESVIKVAKQMGVTHQEIADLCDVTPATVSNWLSENNKAKATYAQIKPMIEKYGEGRFQVELEPLSPAAISYPAWSLWVSHLAFIFFVLLFAALYGYLSLTACDNFGEDSQCHKEAWYDKPWYFHKLAAEGRLSIKEISQE